ncbi:synaptogyrin-2b [Chanos chanos]|uniref:Synaptogyrin n=1 Tax=Chanos chanos TaxID=29144 RepID=A0A6J2V6J4_CHACN|nr:synaptogyrin-2 [Chanos chanos]
METGTTSVYGASLAGGSFDLISFVKKPQTIVRILSWVFAIVVFACITGEGYVNVSTSPEAKCVFNQNDGACHYGVGIGVIAFLACVVFIILDAYFPLISNANDRKYIVVADLVFSGAWTFLWFVCFCFLANQWSHTTDPGTIPNDAVHAVVAFSFFSVGSWAALTYFALIRYRQGVGEVTQNFPEAAIDHASQPPYPTGGPDIYQQPPFMPNPESQGESGYQPPAY